MPKVSGGKTPAARSIASTQGVDEALPTEAPRSSSKRPSDALVPSNNPARKHKKVKILSRRHKSRHGEGGSWSHSKGKEPTASIEEPEGHAESPDEARTSVFVRPRSMKDLCGTKKRARWENLRNSSKVWRDHVIAEEFERGLLHPQLARELYTLPSEVLLARATKEMVLMTLFNRVHDASQLITFMDYRINNLLEEIETLKAGDGLEAVAAAEERVAKLEKRTKALQRLETSDKELNEVRGDLSKAQKQLKEAQVRARKADDDLLKSVKDLESTRAELLKRAIDDYKESAGFKEGLKRMGRVAYEYGYRVALARFRSSHPDSEVEEDPFTVRPKDDLVPMERQHAFDDSDPPES
ncbi:hypothetical protein BHM03_00010886 [Ensete ventricosum]|nr:hypothetical protein BHM03_00010886 [Ensete ventricosum]